MKTTFKEKMSKFGNSLLNLIFPNKIKCIFCGTELNENCHTYCEHCKDTLPFITSCCDRCGLPMSDEHLEVCSSCKRQNYNFVKARSVFSYIDLPLDVVRKVKFRKKKIFLPEMAELLYKTFLTWNISVDLVTYVPMYPKNEKERGFNQSKILAEEFSRLSNIPITYCCEKILNTQNQRDLSFEKRKENIKDAFKIIKESKPEIKDKVILIIDDVFTTGATTSELALTLKRANVKDCYVLTFAHTILKNNL